MVRLKESVARNRFSEASVFSAGGRKGNASPGSAGRSTLESAADRLESGELAMYRHTAGVRCRDGGIFVIRRANRQSPHEVSEGGTAGHGYRGRIPMRTMMPIPQ